MSRLRSSKVLSVFTYNLSWKLPYRKRSGDMRSGNHGGQSQSPTLRSPLLGLQHHRWHHLAMSFILFQQSKELSQKILIIFRSKHHLKEQWSQNLFLRHRTPNINLLRIQWIFIQGKWVFSIAYSAALSVIVSTQVEACPHPLSKKEPKCPKRLLLLAKETAIPTFSSCCHGLKAMYWFECKWTYFWLSSCSVKTYLGPISVDHILRYLGNNRGRVSSTTHTASLKIVTELNKLVSGTTSL
jgi:hypothetical protein